MTENLNIYKHDWVNCGTDENPEYAIVRKITEAGIQLSNGKQCKLSEIKGIPLTLENLLLNGYETSKNIVHIPANRLYPVFALRGGKLVGNHTIHHVQHVMRQRGLICASYLWKIEPTDNHHQETFISEQMLLNSGLLHAVDEKGRSIFFFEHDDNWQIIHNEDSVVYTLMYDNDYLSCWHIEKLQYYFDVLGINIKLHKQT